MWKNLWLLQWRNACNYMVVQKSKLPSFFVTNAADIDHCQNSFTSIFHSKMGTKLLLKILLHLQHFTTISYGVCLWLVKCGVPQSVAGLVGFVVITIADLQFDEVMQLWNFGYLFGPTKVQRHWEFYTVFYWFCVPFLLILHQFCALF